MLLGIVAGVIIGIFFRDQARVLEPLGQAFVMLLQMPVLIFMFCSIIVGIGSMSLKDVKSIISSTLLFLVASYLFTRLSIWLIPHALPPIKHIHHFASLASSGPELSLMNAFIPENPFRSFADGSVPAVVIFSIFFAVALLSVGNRFVLLKNISVAQEASMAMVRFVTKLSIFGIMAITASSVHHLRFMAIPELKYYYLAFMFGAVFVSVIMLPMLVSVFLPTSYSRLMGPLLPALILALVTGNLIITLPLVLTALKTNVRDCSMSEAKTHGVISALVPLSINFPVSGKLLNLLFLYFASWHYQDQIDTNEEVLMTLTGFLTSFGSAQEGINYLLTSLKLPKDALILFESSLAVTGQFIALARVASIAVLCFFTITSFEQRLTFRPKALILALAVVLASFSGWFYFMSTQKAVDEQENPCMALSVDKPVAHTMATDVSSLKSRDTREPFSLQQIRKKGAIRIVVSRSRAPFSYVNNKNELVGYDIELAHMLARDLGVSIEFISSSSNGLAQLFESRKIDMAFSSIGLTSDQLLSISFSEPYLKSEHVLVAKDYIISKLDDHGSAHYLPDYTLYALKDTSLYNKAEALFAPNKVIAINSYKEFFSMPQGILYWSVAEATTWVLQHPEYGMVKAFGDGSFDELAIALAYNSHDLREFVNQWLEVQRSSKVLDGLYRKWALCNASANEAKAP